jgi:hypothetical protein
MTMFAEKLDDEIGIDHAHVPLSVGCRRQIWTVSEAQILAGRAQPQVKSMGV